MDRDQVVGGAAGRGGHCGSRPFSGSLRRKRGQRGMAVCGVGGQHTRTSVGGWKGQSSAVGAADLAVHAPRTGRRRLVSGGQKHSVWTPDARKSLVCMEFPFGTWMARPYHQ